MWCEANFIAAVSGWSQEEVGVWGRQPIDYLHMHACPFWEEPIFSWRGEQDPERDTFRTAVAQPLNYLHIGSLVGTLILFLHWQGSRLYQRLNAKHAKSI